MTNLSYLKVRDDSSLKPQGLFLLSLPMKFQNLNVMSRILLFCGGNQYTQIIGSFSGFFFFEESVHIKSKPEKALK